MGTGLLVVSSLWFFTGYNLGVNAFGITGPQALALGVGLGATVFLIDRMMLLTSGKQRSFMLMRGLLALAMSLIGGAGLDLCIMRSEVDQTLVAIHQEQHTVMQEQVKERYAKELVGADVAYGSAKNALVDAEQDWKAEMNGDSSGSGLYGNGNVARAKERLVSERRNDLQIARRNKDGIQRREMQDISASENRLAVAQSTGGLFERLHALHRYIASDTMVLSVYVLLTLILVLVELSPLLAKAGFPKTAYEMEMELADSIQLQRAQTIARMQATNYLEQARMTGTEQRAAIQLDAITRSFNDLTQDRAISSIIS